MSAVPIPVVVLKTLILTLGGLITYLAVKAYGRTAARPLRTLAVGFGIVTVGALLAGLADQLIGAAAGDVLIVESTVTAVGFVVIVYSLYQK